MSLVMQRFRKCLEENHIEYHEKYLDTNVITDIHIGHESDLFPIWDVSGYESDDTVLVNLRSLISPELAANIIKIYEDYFHEKKKKEYE